MRRHPHIPVACLGLILCAAPMSFAQKEKPARPPKPPQAAKVPPARGGGNGAGNAQRQPGQPGPQIQRLLNMSPEEREKALASLPPQRRQNIERRLQNFQNMPAGQRQRNLTRAERLNNLQPEQQTKVRKSLRDFDALPQDRQVAVGREMDRMTTMTAAERQTLMNSEDFKSRYSPEERQMMGNISKILPDNR